MISLINWTCSNSIINNMACNCGLSFTVNYEPEIFVYYFLVLCDVTSILFRYRNSTASTPEGESRYTIESSPLTPFNTPTKFSSLQAYKSKVIVYAPTVVGVIYTMKAIFINTSLIP